MNCEESCGIASAATCEKWKECYKNHDKGTIELIEEEIKRNKEFNINMKCSKCGKESEWNSLQLCNECMK